ncbi:MAG: sigma-70 family RNA polymerase sigma factor [Leptolyngbya sp. IPPAS B-1204]|nr:sigma-70 family RNA polymerase sigma factor [Elainella sp. C42_A2020_010]RNJ68963.1 MAG: sigma-70 family RNA polymerase sigma factor [Leptolyngbya sp. IPPAS B-1204]
MRPRQQITELFSTFLQFEADRFDRWVADARLRRRMQQLEQTKQVPTSEQFWALYWYKHWQVANLGRNGASQVGMQAGDPQPQAGLHLSAYLQESCYWAAQQTVRKFTDLHYRLPDCFQIAVAEVPAVLKGYNPERGASLKTYAGIAFSSVLRDALRQRQVVDLSTGWSLLRRTSKKRLLEALHQAGLAETTIAPYRLAWLCFNQLYVPAAPGERLPKPDPAFWEAVAQLYNQERHQLVPPGPAVQAATIERWLTQMANWVRSYLYPAVGSLNTPKFSEEATEVQDTLADPTSDSLLTELIEAEESDDRSHQQAKLNQTLTTALSQLDSQSQDILRLYYQQGKTQQQIMQEMAISQASVSRRLSKAREKLLTALVQWGQSLNIAPTPTLIKDMSTALDEWLNARYQMNGTAPST